MKNELNFVPQWAKTVVWYQIFPERFRNGNPNVNPTIYEQDGTYPFDISKPWQIHPWSSDWYKLQDYEIKNGKGLWHNLRKRRYSGDLQGIIDKLDYLKELGVGAIYLNPVFYAPSHHLYDAICYHHCQPSFGPDPEGDKAIIASEIPDDPKTWKFTSADLLLLKLIDEVHKRDMKIILDGVFNHMGMMNFALQDIIKNGKNSKYTNWFEIDWQQYAKDPNSMFWKGWFNVKELPELKKVDDNIASEPKAYIFECTKRWMAPIVNGIKRDGIHGWRLDVAWFIGHQFWNEWRMLVKSLNPQAYLTAEIVEMPDSLKPYLQGDEFDAVMNYNFARLSAEYFIFTKNQLSPTQFDKGLSDLRNLYPSCVSYVMQNLFDSHDTHRLSSMIANPDVETYREWGKHPNRSIKEQNPDFITTKPNAKEFELLKLMIIFQFTYLGAPMIYYGSECGMWGANDPCDRKPMIWDDIQFDDEKYLADGNIRTKGDKVEINQDIFSHYKKLISIRNNHKALQLGDFQTILADDKNSIYSFSRNYENETIVVIINKANTNKRVDINISGKYYDLLNDCQINGKDKLLTLEVKPIWGAVLLKL